MSDHSSPRPQTGRTTAGGQLVLGPRLETFKRFYRWFNLTLLHQGLWPLLLLLTTAPSGAPGTTPSPWFFARIGAPLIAAAAAFLYLRQHSPLDDAPTRFPFTAPATNRPALATQVRFLLLGLPVMLAAVRILEGPTAPAAKLIAFGLADVAAFQLIHFGVVRRSYSDPAQGIGLAIGFFALSWAVRDLMLALAGSNEFSAAGAFLTGALLGLAFAALSRALYAWPGGRFTAASVQFLLVYLVAGFA